MYGAYYIYDMDMSKNSYYIAIFGDQIAAASTCTFGSTMLQNLAQKISGVPELKLDFRNDLLPINNGLLPQSKPKIAEAYGVTVLTVCIFLITLQIQWHGKPIYSGFQHAYIVKGGSKTGYMCAKYLKMVI